MAKTKKKATVTPKPKKTKSKKYQSLTTKGLECLDCTLPMHVCCGIPRQCKTRYEKYLEKKAEAELKQDTRRRRKNVSVKSV
ncbi:MAG: hypothetical protein K2O89_07580 [Clostridia bacterium]|nr:hypothetical protein [Clostridia bacterium]